MKRNLTFEEISDGHKYCANDLVKVSCNDCNGCSECCRVTDDTIHLDPYDVFSLSKKLSLSFNDMLGKYIDLTVVDGVITPFLKKTEGSSVCSFLSSEGRCTIHDARPGFCRLFPLGRIYEEDGTFKYFIQVHECPYPNKSKVKVSKWLGIPRLSKYEEFICKWHEITSNISECVAENPDLAKAANMKMLEVFFASGYDTEGDFYSQFEGKELQYQA